VAPGLVCDGGAVESGFGSIGPAALHAGIPARGAEITAQLDGLRPESAVPLLATGTQIVDPLLAVGLLALGQVARRLASAVALWVVALCVVRRHKPPRSFLHRFRYPISERGGVRLEARRSSTDLEQLSQALLAPDKLGVGLRWRHPLCVSELSSQRCGERCVLVAIALVLKYEVKFLGPQWAGCAQEVRFGGRAQAAHVRDQTVAVQPVHALASPADP
jgi:hypothetical protein